MLDPLSFQVNEEIEASVQVTREIESEIVKCSEAESALSNRESELAKMVYMLDFEISGLISVTGKTSVQLPFLSVPYLLRSRIWKINLTL